MTLRSATHAFVPVESPLPLGDVLFRRERHMERLYEEVIRSLVRVKAKEGLTDEVLGLRLGKTAEQIDVLLSSPEGWTFDTAIDVLTAARLEIDTIRIAPIAARR